MDVKWRKERLQLQKIRLIAARIQKIQNICCPVKFFNNQKYQVIMESNTISKVKRIKHKSYIWNISPTSRRRKLHQIGQSCTNQLQVIHFASSIQLFQCFFRSITTYPIASFLFISSYDQDLHSKSPEQQDIISQVLELTEI